MKNILLIATGGTIASRPSQNGLTPELQVEDLLSYVPEVAELCVVNAVQLFNLDSTNVFFRHWLKIAECIEKNYSLYDGFVITHGTDTMAYTAAALSYLVQNSQKPIVLTGSQKSIYMRDSDARSNLIDAFVYAVDDHACGVKVVFDKKVIIGTRAKKMRTKSFNAFSSIDYPEEAIIVDGKVFYYIPSKVEKEVEFYRSLNDKVFVIKLFPGMDVGIFNYIKSNFDAVIIEGFGVGGMPSYENDDFYSAVGELVKNNTLVVITTQVAHEGSDLGIYEVGTKLKSLGVAEARGMTFEAIVAKVMWALAQTNSMSEAKELFLKEIDRDILFI